MITISALCQDLSDEGEKVPGQVQDDDRPKEPQPLVPGEVYFPRKVPRLCATGKFELELVRSSSANQRMNE